MSDGGCWDKALLLDHSFLDDYTGHDPDLKADVLNIFKDKAPGYLSDLASDDGNWAARAHKLKGAARGIGAWNLAVAAERAEQMSEPPLNSDHRHQIIADLSERLNALLNYLDEKS